MITYLFFLIQISERAKLFANFVLGVSLEQKRGREGELMRVPGNEVNCKRKCCGCTSKTCAQGKLHNKKDVVGGVRHNLAMKLRTRT